jgi:hypothetical protein
MNYKKESKLKEEIFLLSHLFLITKYAIQSNSPEKFHSLSYEIENTIKSNISKFSSKTFEKWQKIIAKINLRSGLLELYECGESSHKLVLVLYAIFLQLKLENYEISEEAENLMETLLEIENSQEMNSEEWLRFKKSADKRGAKILAKLQKLGMF